MGPTSTQSMPHLVTAGQKGTADEEGGRAGTGGGGGGGVTHAFTPGPSRKAAPRTQPQHLVRSIDSSVKPSHRDENDAFAVSLTSVMCNVEGRRGKAARGAGAGGRGSARGAGAGAGGVSGSRGIALPQPPGAAQSTASSSAPTTPPSANPSPPIVTKWGSGSSNASNKSPGIIPKSPAERRVMHSPNPSHLSTPHLLPRHDGGGSGVDSKGSRRLTEPTAVDTNHANSISAAILNAQNRSGGGGGGGGRGMGGTAPQFQLPPQHPKSGGGGGKVGGGASGRGVQLPGMTAPQ